MTKVTVANGTLKLEILGWDRLWCFKSRLEFPMSHVSGVRPALGEKVRGIRAPGTFLPGLIAAGTWHKGGKRAFWDVHDIKNAIAIDLRDSPYEKAVIEVECPMDSMDSIKSAIS